MTLVTDIFYSRSFPIHYEGAACTVINAALDCLDQLGQFFSCKISDACDLILRISLAITAYVKLLAFRCFLIFQRVSTGRQEPFAQTSTNDRATSGDLQEPVPRPQVSLQAQEIVDPAAVFAKRHGKRGLEDRDEKGNTLLHRFVEEGDLANIQAILALGAKVNAANKQGITPLHIAFPKVKGHGIFAIELLKQHGARFDEQDSDGKVPIYYLLPFLEEMEEECLRSLFAVEPNMLIAPNRDGNTFIYFIVRFAPSLLPLAASVVPDMSIQNGEGKTPQQVFADFHGVENIDAPGTDGYPLAYRFILDNRLDCLKALAVFGANFNVVAEGAPLLFAAVGLGNAAAVRILAEGGADLNVKNRGATLAHLAVHNIKDPGVLQCLRILHSFGADLYAQEDNSGAPPIHLLPLGVEETTVKELLAIDSKLLLSQNKEGETLAHLMAKKKWLVLFFALLKKAGVEPIANPLFVRDRQGNTALHLASLEEVRPFLDHIHKEALEICNNQGWRPVDYWRYSASESFLTKAKVVREAVDLSEHAFKVRAKALKKHALSLWDSLFSLPFGKGFCKVPRDVFSFTRRGGSLVAVSPSQVRAALVIMLNRIVDKAPWLGTPRADQMQELHGFYTHMLINFERVIESLQRDPDSMDERSSASFLTSAWSKVKKRASAEDRRRRVDLRMGLLRQIAKTLFEVAIPQLEERCVAAYQEDIEQIAEIGSADGDALTAQALLEKNIALFLGRVADSVIETSIGVIGGAHENSAHVRPQLRSLLGLRSLPDPMGDQQYSQDLVMACFEKIKKRWVFPQLLLDLQEVFKELPMDSVLFWLRDQIDDEFFPSYILLKEEAEAREQALQEQTRAALLERNFEGEQVEEALQFFTSVNGASCSFIHSAVLTQSDPVTSFLGLVEESCSEMQALLPRQEEIEGIFAGKQLDSEESWQECFGEIKKKMHLPDGQERLSFQQMTIWVEATALFIKSILNKQKAQKELVKHVPQERVQEALESKYRYDEEMKAISSSLMEGADVSINLQMYGLASTAIEQQRRLTFENKHVEEVEIRRMQLVEGEEREIVEYKRIPNQLGALLIACHLGILDENKLF